MRIALILSISALVAGQPVPKTKPADYPVHVQMDSVILAAEYLVHSLPTERGTLFAKDYLVVEAAFFGPRLSRLKLSPDQFTLRINGRGTPLTTQLPGLVASSIQFPNSDGGGFSAGGSIGVGDGTVAVGPRSAPSQFPGDGNDRTSQPTLTVQKEQEDKVEYRVQNASLPEGEQSLPRSGLLYFSWHGKTKNIRSLELFYDGPMGKSVLKLVQ